MPRKIKATQITGKESNILYGFRGMPAHQLLTKRIESKRTAKEWLSEQDHRGMGSSEKQPCGAMPTNLRSSPPQRALRGEVGPGPLHTASIRLCKRIEGCAIVFQPFTVRMLCSNLHSARTLRSWSEFCSVLPWALLVFRCMEMPWARIY